jgi:hypothetical protein
MLVLLLRKTHAGQPVGILLLTRVGIQLLYAEHERIESEVETDLTNVLHKKAKDTVDPSEKDVLAGKTLHADERPKVGKDGAGCGRDYKRDRERSAWLAHEKKSLRARGKNSEEIRDGNLEVHEASHLVVHKRFHAKDVREDVVFRSCVHGEFKKDNG